MRVWVENIDFDNHAEELIDGDNLDALEAAAFLQRSTPADVVRAALVSYAYICRTDPAVQALLGLREEADKGRYATVQEIQEGAS